MKKRGRIMDNAAVWRFDACSDSAYTLQAAAARKWLNYWRVGRISSYRQN